MIDSVKPEEIADQLTLMDFKIFKAIKPRECLGQAWKKKNRKEGAPNILRMISHFNSVCKWIQLQILKAPNLRARTNEIKRAIKIARQCHIRRNFSALFAVYSALNAQAIYRLNHAWSNLRAKHGKMFSEFKVLFSRDKNQKNLRQALICDTPAIPHIGIFLQDLVFIDDGNRDREKDGQVNFSKCMRLHERIKYMAMYQQAPFSIEVHAKLEEKLEHDLAAMEKLTEEKLWQLSSEIKKQDDTAAQKSFF